MTEPERQSIRNDIIARRKYVIDANYSAYEAEFGWQNQGFGFAADTASLGLNTAGTLVPISSTTRLLGGIAGAVTGVKGNYQADLLAAKTGQIIQSQMRANRDIVAARILRNMGQSTAVYPLSLAYSDLEDLFRAGTLTSGLINAADVVGVNAQNAEALKPDTIILNTTFSADAATGALKKFLFPNGVPAGINRANESRLNALLADSGRFQRAPDGKPWIVQQILFGPNTAELRLQLARAAGILP